MRLEVLVDCLCDIQFDYALLGSMFCLVLQTLLKYSEQLVQCVFFGNFVNRQHSNDQIVQAHSIRSLDKDPLALWL